MKNKLKNMLFKQKNAQAENIPTHTDVQYPQSNNLCTKLHKVYFRLLKKNSLTELNNSDLVIISVIASVNITSANITKKAILNLNSIIPTLKYIPRHYLNGQSRHN